MTDRETPALPADVRVHAKWCEDAARYFERRATGGEDAAHWANVYNAESARKVAATLTAQAARIRELEAERDAAKTECFNFGYVLASANILHLHDEPVIASDVLREAGLGWSEITAMDLSDYDMDAIKVIAAEGDGGALSEPSDAGEGA